jgi:phage-related minor tail protein
MAVSAGKTADGLITLSNKTGITTQALQEMSYAARFIDVDVETMTGSMQKLTKNMDMARRGSKEQEEAFKSLEIEFKNQDGSLRNAKDVWAEAIEALGSVSSEADRDALAMNLFGKSAAELNPLIKAGSAELKRLGQEAHNTGAVLSDETVTSLGKFDDMRERCSAGLATAAAQIGAAFLPVLEKLAPLVEEKIVPAIQSFAGYITGLIDKFNNLSPGMQKFVLAAAGIAIAVGPVFSAVGKVTSGLVG